MPPAAMDTEAMTCGSSQVCNTEAFVGFTTQRLQYHLTKEYTLNYSGIPHMI